mmetsp:Transcript_1642/g.3650  ORF Transcript_1642/g.3650 Transcript_1642/m.3650 type:complete len:367 (+) Transcript_1642:601-1701(+)
MHGISGSARVCQQLVPVLSDTLRFEHLVSLGGSFTVLEDKSLKLTLDGHAGPYQFALILLVKFVFFLLGCFDDWQAVRANNLLLVVVHLHVAYFFLLALFFLVVVVVVRAFPFHSNQHQALVLLNGLGTSLANDTGHTRDVAFDNPASNVELLGIEVDLGAVVGMGRVLDEKERHVDGTRGVCGGVGVLEELVAEFFRLLLLGKFLLLVPFHVGSLSFLHLLHNLLFHLGGVDVGLVSHDPDEILEGQAWLRRFYQSDRLQILELPLFLFPSSFPGPFLFLFGQVEDRFDRFLAGFSRGWDRHDVLDETRGLAEGQRRLFFAFFPQFLRLVDHCGCRCCFFFCRCCCCGGCCLVCCPLLMLLLLVG